MGCLGSSDDGNEQNEANRDPPDEDDEAGGDDGDDDQEYAQAGVSSSDGEVVVNSMADNTAGVYCGDADIEDASDIEEGENGATSVGGSFPCDDDIYGITEDGTTTKIA